MKKVGEILILLSILLIACVHYLNEEQMSGIAGVGTVFYRWNGDDWDAIAEVRAIIGPSLSKDTVNVTSLDTDDGFNEFISGFSNGGIVALAMSFTRSTYEIFKQDFEASDAKYYGIMLADEDSTFFDFMGLVTELPLGIVTDDKVDVNVKIQVSGVLGEDLSSGDLPSYYEPSEEPPSSGYTPEVPTVVEASWGVNVNYATITFTDNTDGVAQHEIWRLAEKWYSDSTEDYELVTTLDAGVTSYNDTTWQNSDLTYKIRAKYGSEYSAYSAESETFRSPWCFRMDQSTLNHVFIYRFIMHPGYTGTIDWGDGTHETLEGYAPTAYDKDYTTEGIYYAQIRGSADDMDHVYQLEWYYATPQVAPDIACCHDTDITYWVFPKYFYFAHLYNMAFIGDITNIKYPTQVRGLHLGGSNLSGDVSNWDVWPEFYWDVHVNSNLKDSNDDYALGGDVSGWRASTFNAHNQIYGNFYGDMTNYVAHQSPTYGTLFFNVFSDHPIGLYGDLSGWNIPTRSTHYSYIGYDCSGGGCHFTGMPRGHFIDVDEFLFTNNNCDQTEIDSLLEYIDAYFSMFNSSDEPSSEETMIPIQDITIDLTGATMGTPSAAGLAAKASIEAKYTAAGYTATINVNS